VNLKKIPAVMLERRRIELFTQWHFRAEFTAFISRMFCALVTEEIYKNNIETLPTNKQY